MSVNFGALKYSRAGARPVICASVEEFRNAPRERLLISDSRSRVSSHSGAARRGQVTKIHQQVSKASFAANHVPPRFPELGLNMHKATDVGIDDFQTNWPPDRTYRTAPLPGLWAHQIGGFCGNGRFSGLMDVVNHYDEFE